MLIYTNFHLYGLDLLLILKPLRKGTIGSRFNTFSLESELSQLNTVGHKIVCSLLNQCKDRARSVAKYYLDMQQVVSRCNNMLNDNGVLLFVIGNTEFKGVKIDNAQYLAQAMKENNFQKIYVTKRKISNKILTSLPGQTKGALVQMTTICKVYSEEFILIGTKN